MVGPEYRRELRETVMDLTFLPAAALAKLTQRRQIGCLEFLDHYISRVERLDPRINAVVVRDFDRARDRARSLDQSKDRFAPLFGVPMTIKESFNVAGLPTSWGATALKDWIAQDNALAVDRLLNAGVVLLGKTNVPILLGDWQSKATTRFTARLTIPGIPDLLQRFWAQIGLGNLSPAGAWVRGQWAYLVGRGQPKSLM